MGLMVFQIKGNSECRKVWFSPRAWAIMERRKRGRALIEGIVPVASEGAREASKEIWVCVSPFHHHFHSPCLLPAVKRVSTAPATRTEVTAPADALSEPLAFTISRHRSRMHRKDISLPIEQKHHNTHIFGPSTAPLPCDEFLWTFSKICASSLEHEVSKG